MSHNFVFLCIFRRAEANGVIVLYPQTTKTVLNPNRCWDWWGYTGTDYASKLGVQIMTVKAMADSLVDGSATLLKA